MGHAVAEESYRTKFEKGLYSDLTQAASKRSWDWLNKAIWCARTQRYPSERDPGAAPRPKRMPIK